MTIQEEIDTDLKDAMRSRDAERLAVLRMVKSALTNAAIEKRGATGGLADAEALGVIRKQVKQRQDSIESFEKGGRPELAAKERKEIEFLREYLPKPLGEDEIDELVKHAIAEVGATSKAQMGAVMKIAHRKSGRASRGENSSAKLFRRPSDESVVGVSCQLPGRIQLNGASCHFKLGDLTTLPRQCSTDPADTLPRTDDLTTGTELTTSSMVSAIIVAAGSSQRMGFDKLWSLLGDKPVVAHSIDRFQRCDEIDEVICRSGPIAVRSFKNSWRIRDLPKFRVWSTVDPRDMSQFGMVFLNWRNPARSSQFTMRPVRWSLRS